MLIGITGKAGSGKTTAAEALIGAGWVRVKMADPLKDMLRAIGLTDQHIEGDLKEVPCDLLCGQTPRHAMITLGTEWGRDHIGLDFWTGIAKARIQKLLLEGRSVVVDDIRYQNEADVIHDMGGTIVQISRPSSIAISHKSESGVPFDIEYRNIGTPENLRNWVRYVFLMAD